MPNNQNQSMNQGQRNTQIAVGIAVVVIVGLLAWWLFSKPTSDVGTMAPSTATTTTDTATSGTAASDTTDLSGMTTADVTTAATNEAVTIVDQQAGDSVRVASVTLAKTGWVAVRDSLRIYGAAWLTAGTHTDVTVPLLRNTVPGSKYSVVLYADDGDKAFNFHVDSLITGVSSTFSTTN